METTSTMEKATGMWTGNGTWQVLASERTALMKARVASFRCCLDRCGARPGARGTPAVVLYGRALEPFGGGELHVDG